MVDEVARKVRRQVEAEAELKKAEVEAAKARAMVEDCQAREEAKGVWEAAAWTVDDADHKGVEKEEEQRLDEVLEEATEEWDRRLPGTQKLGSERALEDTPGAKSSGLAPLLAGAAIIQDKIVHRGIPARRRGSGNRNAGLRSASLGAWRSVEEGGGGVRCRVGYDVGVRSRDS